MPLSAGMSLTKMAFTMLPIAGGSIRDPTADVQVQRVIYGGAESFHFVIRYEGQTIQSHHRLAKLVSAAASIAFEATEVQHV